MSAALVVAAVLAAASTTAAPLRPAQSSTGAFAATSSAAWIRAVRPEGSAAPELLELGLGWPGLLVELGLVPLAPLLHVFERYHVPARLFDLFTNEAGTFGVFPLFDPGFDRSGLGGGVAVLHNEPLGSADRFVLLALVRRNADRLVSLSLSRRVPQLSGRVLALSASHELDTDLPWFGGGPGTPREPAALLALERTDLALGISLLPPEELPEWQLELGLGFHHQRLTAPDPGDRRPPGLGAELDLPELSLSLGHDSRDSFGRTSRGALARLELFALADTGGTDLGALGARARFGLFLPLLPLYRLLFLGGGAALSLPWPGDQVPYAALPTLGGSRVLRGYPGERFQGSAAWWLQAEYRFEFYRYADSGVGLSATLFADTGQVGSTAEELLRTPLPWSVGLGLRLEQTLILLGRLQLAWSPEGLRLSAGFGELL